MPAIDARLCAAHILSFREGGHEFGRESISSRFSSPRFTSLVVLSVNSAGH